MNGTGATSNIEFIVAAGDALATAAGLDTVTGFLAADGTNVSDLLNFAGTGAVGALATSTDFGTITSHSITTGVASFDDASSFSTALVISSTNLTNVVGYLAANSSTLDVIAFDYDSNSDGTADSTMLYSNGTTDSLVLLAGVIGVTSLVATNATTANAIFIA